MSYPWHQIPNLLTVARIILVAPIVYCLLNQRYQEALWLFFIAGFSDGLDGFLARHFHWGSRFGAIADPLADKLLLVSVFIALTVSGWIPLWLTILVFARDLIIVAGALTFHMLIGAYRMEPSIWGKLSTLGQILYLLATLIVAAELPLPAESLVWGLWLVTGLTLFSGVHYITRWGLRFVRARRELDAANRRRQSRAAKSAETSH